MLEPQPSSGKSRRDDVDGLRAIAIIAVVLYHAGVPFFKGGFIGVDVFFVISGYLITQKIAKDWHAGTWSYTKFWEGRVRRLFPAMVPVLIATTLGCFLYFEPSAFEDYSKSLVASALNMANWFFLAQDSYFDATSETKPLLHLWSLGVEAQFYLLFPLVLVSALRMSLRDRPVILSLGVLSFVFSCWLLFKAMPEEAFFNSLARFWELMVGAALATYQSKLVLSRWVGKAAPLLGLSMIVGSIFLLDVSMPFPGPLAMPAVIGAAMVILAGLGKQNIVAVVLSLRPLSYVGRVSYSWYLWHWPIIVLLPMVFANEAEALGPWLLVSGAAGAFLLAMASTTFIENPIIRRQVLPSAQAMVRMGAATTVCFIVLGMPGQVAQYAIARAWVLNGDRGVAAFRMKEEDDFYRVNLNLNADGKRELPDSDQRSQYTCSFDRNGTADQVFGCVTALADERNVLVAGDSIGRDMFHALSKGYPDTNFIMLHNSGCPPVERLSEKATCFPGIDGLLGRIAASINVSGVLISYRFRPDNMDRLPEMLAMWRSHFSNVALVGVSPIFSKTLGQFTLESQTLPATISIKDESMVPWDYFGLVSAASAEALKAGAKFVDTLEYWCPQGQCRIWHGGDPDHPIYWDSQHLTRYGIAGYSRYLEADEDVRDVVLGS